jgi:hypothetical protein
MLFLSPCVVHACFISYRTAQAGTTFRVRVTDRGRPVSTLRLVLNSSALSGKPGSESIYSLTDKDGLATFSNVILGSFMLIPEYDVGIADGVVVEVSANGPTNVTVPLRWPSRTPVSVESISGIVRGPDYYPSQKQIQLSLSLLEGLSGRVIATTNTDEKGRFNFHADTPPGVYFLRLNRSGLRGWSGEEMEGMVAIEVTPAAKDRELDLDLGWSSCGLGAAQGQIHPELKVPKICGDIADRRGAVVSGAQIRLLTRGDEPQILEQTKSGMKGNFALREQREGTYQLFIQSAGFQPLVLPIRVEPAGPSGGCRKPMHTILDGVF